MARRRFRVSVIGSIELDTDNAAPEAVEHVRRLLDQIGEHYKLYLAVGGVELLGPLD
jgi:hypothetical protein